jgi:uncharacterized protein YndB with AHSA1/START domain/DNA-binding transcriptional ArsR family regulator
MVQLDLVFAALADPTRRAILARLAQGEATVNELVAPFQLRQPTISKHLKVLEGAGLVSRSKSAQFRPVRLNPEPLAGAARWFGDYQRFWEESLTQLGDYAKELQHKETIMNARETIAERELIVTRDFDVPARFLFEAYSKPEHISRWFGPKGWPITLCEMDFRVGGRWRFAMTGPGGKQNTPFGGEYLEIVPNKRIVFDNSFDEPNAQKMIMTVTFEEKDGKTRIAMHTLFATKEMRAEYVGHGMEAGINSGFDQLEEVVAELKRKSRA